jgi:Polyketide cyclase / dehydrase and lipid transport
MPSYEASAATHARPEAAWTAWTDVEGWSAYDHIESARLDGSFQPGVAITSKAKGFPSSTLTVTRVEPPSLWVDETRSPGIRMTFDHVIEAGAGGTQLTERVHISGPLGHVLGPLMRRKLEALFAASVAAVSRQAESAEAPAGPPTS